MRVDSDGFSRDTVRDSSSSRYEERTPNEYHFPIHHTRLPFIQKLKTSFQNPDALTELRYTRRARFLYVLSVMIPFAAMAFFNNSALREYWASPDVQRDPEINKETVTELGSDVDGIRAYFLARSWTPFRLPAFLLGTCLWWINMRSG